MNDPIVFALAGNPNCGKTTLFNALTGNHYQVGNWAGVTVERKEGVCTVDRQDRTIKIVDLPGIYSLSPNSAEEKIARDFILHNRPDLLINIIDATNLERNLYLTMQLAEARVPMIVALNMMDALQSVGISVRVKKLEKRLGIRVLPISASKGQGIRELIQAACSVFEECSTSSVRYSAQLEAMLRSRREKEQEPRRIAEQYRWIHSITRECVQIIGKNRQAERTRKLDRIVNHPVWAIPIFMMVLLFIFQVTFGTFGSGLSDFTDTLFNVKFAGWVRVVMERLGASAFMRGLVIEGILAGVGGVVAFFPQIMLLFLFLSLMEDSGYMARTTFIMDKFFVRLGLSGKSFVPMILGFGCSVPAMMAVRTLENERDRRLTLMLIPFMSCGAKMPVYAVFVAALFPKQGGAVLSVLYLLGILLGVISEWIFSKTVLKGELPPFVLELPPYRMPTLKSTLRRMWEKAKDFAERAGTVLLFASVIIWLLRSVDFTLHMTGDCSESILGTIGRRIAPVFAPCGFGQWQPAVSLLSGFAAKEAVVSTMSILYGAGDAAALESTLSGVFTPLSGFAFLVFVLLYVPCIAAVSTLRTELNSAKLTLLSVMWQLGIAWIMSMTVYQIGSLFV